MVDPVQVGRNAYKIPYKPDKHQSAYKKLYYAKLKFFEYFLCFCKHIFSTQLCWYTLGSGTIASNSSIAHQYKGKNKVLLIAFLTSFIVQFLAIFTQYFIFLALGVRLPLFYSLFVFPVITLASFFIPSLNGVGVQDALYVQLFQVVYIIPELALSASILYHLFRLGVSLIGGVLYAAGKAD